MAPTSHNDHQHHRDGSPHSVFSTALLDTPPPSSRSQLLQTPSMPYLSPLSPISPADTLPPISPAARVPPTLRGIRELGLGMWTPSSRFDPMPTGSIIRSSSSSQHSHRGQGTVPSALSTPSMSSPDLLVTPQLGGRGGLSDGEIEEGHHWDDHYHHHGGERYSPMIRATRAGAPSPKTPDIGRMWWNGVVGGTVNPTRPAPSSPLSRLPSPIVPISPPHPEIRLHQSTPHHHEDDGEEVDELDDDDDDIESRRSSMMPPVRPAYHHQHHRSEQFLPANRDHHYLLRHVDQQRSISASPHRRPSMLLPPHVPHPCSPRRAHQVDNCGYMYPTSSSSSAGPSPSGSTISLPSPIRNRRTKPNHLNRQNVPLYNRSKPPNPNEPAFACKYFPPRSSDPLAPQPPMKACETTALKKADMERHFEEIHAKEEAERTMRKEIDIGFAGRYLVDVAATISKEMKANPSGHTLVPPLPQVPGNGPHSPPAPSAPSRWMRNIDLRAQADNVRLRVGAILVDTRAAAYHRFDFVANQCREFREIALDRLATYRVWVCPEGDCGRQFGSQRSMERHRTNKHPGTTTKLARGKKRSKAAVAAEEAAAAAGPELGSPFAGPPTYFGSLSPAGSPFGPSLSLDTQPHAPLHHPPISPADSPSSTSLPIAKRPRKVSPLKAATSSASQMPSSSSAPSSSSSSSSVTMRVRQQTPEQRHVEQFGFQNHRVQREHHAENGSRQDPIKIEDVDEDLLALAQGAYYTHPSRNGRRSQ